MRTAARVAILAATLARALLAWAITDLSLLLLLWPR